MFFFKQFRSGDGGDDAIYQKILHGPLYLDAMRNLELLHGTWTLKLGVFDSLPVVQTFGLGAPENGKVTLTTNLAFWADCDVTAGVAVPYT